jgi:hypothetical protein
MSTLVKAIITIGVTLGAVGIGASGKTLARVSGGPLNESRRWMTNETLLAECDTGFAARVRAVIQDLEGSGFHPWVAESWRSPKDQVQAFRLGRSKVRFGFHNIVGPGREPRSFAVDLIDRLGSDNPSQEYALRLSTVARAYNLTTGILWGLSSQERLAVGKALRAPHTFAKLKIGWDPCHLEPADLSISQLVASIAGPRR